MRAQIEPRLKTTPKELIARHSLIDQLLKLLVLEVRLLQFTISPNDFFADERPAVYFKLSCTASSSPSAVDSALILLKSLTSGVILLSLSCVSQESLPSTSNACRVLFNATCTRPMPFEIGAVGLAMTMSVHVDKLAPRMPKRVCRIS